jgi:hypothetical protein
MSNAVTFADFKECMEAIRRNVHCETHLHNAEEYVGDLRQMLQKFIELEISRTAEPDIMRKELRNGVLKKVCKTWPQFAEDSSAGMIVKAHDLLSQED